MTRPVERVAVLGLGAMGHRIARRILDTGQHRLTVWNRSPGADDSLVAAGATPAATPAEACRDADLVLVMVRDDRASRDVWFAAESGAVHGIGPDAIAVECSTITPDHARDLERKLADRCRAFVEAPVLGSRPQADAGALVVLAGGGTAGLAPARPVLDTFASRIEPCGAVGQAAHTKLALNAYFATQVAALAELLSALRGAGQSDAVVRGVLEALPIVAPGLQLALGSMIEGRFAPQFPIELVAKDLDYFVASSGIAAEASVAARTLDLYRTAVARGLGDDNLTGIVQTFPHGPPSAGQAGP